MKELRRGRNASYGSHESCKSLSEELSDYYGGRHRFHTKPHSQRREQEKEKSEALKRKRKKRVIHMRERVTRMREN